ncbi:MAG: hypothetical protein KDK61_08690 [Simkania sp.]|nr:hypothetical protein [Simkania sp.]
MTPKFKALAEKIHQRKEREDQVRLAGGNKFEQLEARLKDPETGTYGEEIICYGIRTITEYATAKDFLRGYIADVKEHPDKYPHQASKNSRNYAINDVMLELGLHFQSKESHDLWNKAIRNYRK